jgi:hypothetical protein
LKPDRITVLIHASLYLDGRGLAYVRCIVGVECTDPTLLAAVNAARDRGASAKDDSSVSLRSLPQRDWRIAWLRSDLEPRSPVGPGMPGGGPKR